MSTVPEEVSSTLPQQGGLKGSVAGETKKDKVVSSTLLQQGGLKGCVQLVKQLDALVSSTLP
jgi:hypothetical protein